jgi:hypothetical protein
MSNGEKECPICEARRTADPDEADQMKPTLRALCWVIDRQNEKAGPQAWSMPNSLFKEISERSVPRKSGKLLPIDHDEKGHDVLFSREGTKKRTKYSAVEVIAEPTPIHDDEDKQEGWLEYITDNPLPDILNYYDAEHIDKVLHGASARRDAEEEEDEDRAPRRGRRVRGEEDEAVAERDEDAPRRGRRAREEEAEEDTPRSGRRGRKEAEEEEESDDPPSRRAERAASRRSRAEEDEEEGGGVPRRRLRRSGEEEEEEDTGGRANGSRRRAAAEEEEEEAPRSSRRRRAAPEEDEDEEAPPPTRRARGAVERARAGR